MRIYNFKTDSGETIAVRPPKLKHYDKLLTAANDAEAIDAIADIIDRSADYVYENLTTDDAKRFISEFPLWVENIKQSDPN